ncbi:hypothetical protein [Yinghuangia sp. YIM S09857]|uniref:hypothetical protein n=1 Tax=Yinghuangia sp. YIM S09857 TaxID=3436929 RepID=UPI003F537B8B
MSEARLPRKGALGGALLTAAALVAGLLWWAPWTSDDSGKPDPEQAFCRGLVRRGEVERLRGPDGWRLKADSNYGPTPVADLYICNVFAELHKKDPGRVEPIVLKLAVGQFLSPDRPPDAATEDRPTPGAPNVPYFDAPGQGTFRHPLTASLPGYIELNTKHLSLGLFPQYAVRLALPDCSAWAGPDSANRPRYMEYRLLYEPWDTPVPESVMATVAVTTANRLLDANNCDKPRFVVP